MVVKLQLEALRRTRPHECATRFAFGGAVTVLAGLIAERFGPAIGGLFLAFPAIFPASASLIEKHERRKKEKAGLEGSKRGRAAAGIDSAGAAMGCIGLVGFATIAWTVLPLISTWLTLALATVAWATLAISAWIIRRRGAKFAPKTSSGLF